MPTDLSSRSVCVVDAGASVALAAKLAESFGRCYYVNPTFRPFPRVAEATIGNGIEGVEHRSDLWALRDKADLFVFPDNSLADVQAELVRQGKRVWGSRGGVRYENDRIAFRNLIADAGLPVVPIEVVTGLRALREHLRRQTDRYVKVSYFRGSTETWHWIDAALSSGKLDELAIELGPVADHVTFIVCAPIDAVIETGVDSIFCGGRFAGVALHGPESKDKSYLASVDKLDDMPPQIVAVLDAVAPALAATGYANFCSIELRITEDGRGFATDFTARMPCPAGAPQLELWTNLAEVLWHGAAGEAVDPVASAAFVAEAVIDRNDDEERWRTMRVPLEVRNAVKLWNYGMIDDVYVIPPLPHSCTSIGTVFGLGDTPEAAIDALKEHAAALDDQPVTVHVAALAEALRDLQEAQAAGVEAAGQAVPDPAIVLE